MSAKKDVVFYLVCESNIRSVRTCGTQYAIIQCWWSVFHWNRTKKPDAHSIFPNRFKFHVSSIKFQSDNNENIHYKWSKNHSGLITTNYFRIKMNFKYLHSKLYISRVKIVGSILLKLHRIRAMLIKQSIHLALQNQFLEF